VNPPFQYRLPHPAHPAALFRPLAVQLVPVALPAVLALHPVYLQALSLPVHRPVPNRRAAARVPHHLQAHRAVQGRHHHRQYQAAVPPLRVLQAARFHPVVVHEALSQYRAAHRVLH
jgi:hypothetical protein